MKKFRYNNITGSWAIGSNFARRLHMSVEVISQNTAYRSESLKVCCEMTVRQEYVLYLEGLTVVLQT